MQQARSKKSVAVKKISRQRQKKMAELLPVFPMLICILGGFIVTVLISLFLGFILSVTNLPLSWGTAFVMIALFFGAFVCGKICARAFPKERGLMALICAVSGTIVLVVINLIFFREPITALSFVKYGIIIVGCVLGAAFSTHGVNKKRRRLHDR